jgi:diguanylate cyclase (GGDEF)-like protein
MPGHDVLGMLGSMGATDEIGTFARAFRDLLVAKRHAVLQLHRAAAEWAMAFDAVTEAMLCIDAEGRVARINRTASDWLRIAPQAAIGQDAKRLLLGERDPVRFWPESIRLDATRPFRWTGPMPHQEGVFEFRMAPLTQQDELQGVILAVHDVTEQTQRVETIRQQAFYDSLTGLPNRIMILDRLEHGLARAARSGRPLGLLFLDLDHFKQVNDLHGHDAGDALLREAAHRLAAVTRKGDTIGRLGGDEFVMILSDLADPEDAALVASKVIQTLEVPFLIAGASLQIGTSIGIAAAPADGTEVAILLKLADAAMYAAKKGGRSTYRLSSDLTGEAPLFKAAEPGAPSAAVPGEPGPVLAPDPVSRSGRPAPDGAGVHPD